MSIGKDIARKIYRYGRGIIRNNVFLREHAAAARTKIKNSIYTRYSDKTPVDDKLCMFEAFNGRNYSDSPKAVYLRMLNDDKYKDYHFVWAFGEPDKFRFLEKNRNTRVVEYQSKEYMKAYAAAKYWFTPSRLPDYIVPKEGQRYVQFWHGTPLKRLGFDIEVKGKNALHTVDEWSRMYQYDAGRYAYMVSPSRFTTEKYISAFGLKSIGKDKCILETGYPRNDALFTFDDAYVEGLRKELGIPDGKKVILYAPTWRDDQYKVGTGYSYKTAVSFDRLKEEFGDEYVILFRAHYLIAQAIDLNKYEGFVYNVSKYSDINDLYILADMIITDYSSVFFDYANLKRPMLFYMYDLDDYKSNMRDFYIDLGELPGPVITKEDDLIAEIKSIGTYWDRYSDKYKAFNEKFNYLDDKDSSARVLEKVIEG